MTETGQPQQTTAAPQTVPPQTAMSPEIRKPDLQILLQDFAQANQTLFRERRDFERRIADERERSRWEQERIRTEMNERLRESELRNDVLVRTLGRLQGDNDRLREEIAVMKSVRANGHAPTSQPDVPMAAPLQTVVPAQKGHPPTPIPVPTLPKRDVSSMPMPVPNAPQMAAVVSGAAFMPLKGMEIKITERPQA